MTQYNYLVAVFVDGKNVNLYFSENLDELVTVKAMYKKGELDIFDLKNNMRLSNKLVENEIVKAKNRWHNRPIEYVEEKEVQPRFDLLQHVKSLNSWKRPVLCIETGQVFKTIRECSEITGIPYMTVVNCIKNGNSTRGVHFKNAKILTNE